MHLQKIFEEVLHLLLLFSKDELFDETKNLLILDVSIHSVLLTKRFDKQFY